MRAARGALVNQTDTRSQVLRARIGTSGFRDRGPVRGQQILGSETVLRKIRNCSANDDPVSPHSAAAWSRPPAVRPEVEARVPGVASPADAEHGCSSAENQRKRERGLRTKKREAQYKAARHCEDHVQREALHDHVWDESLAGDVQST